MLGSESEEQVLKRHLKEAEDAKIQNMIREYNYLLTSQLEEQRNYYEDRLENVRMLSVAMHGNWVSRTLHGPLALGAWTLQRWSLHGHAPLCGERSKRNSYSYQGAWRGNRSAGGGDTLIGVAPAVTYGSSK